jgi:mono/diheme cytochrome c family protein
MIATAKKLGVRLVAVSGGAVVLLLAYIMVSGSMSAFSAARTGASLDPTQKRAVRLVAEGRNVFRYDTFGDQAVWGGVLGLQKAIEGAKLGGVGPGVSPKTALALGLKVDATKIPPKVAAAIKAGKVNLDDPAVTVSLLKLNAVVGVRGFFNRQGSLTSVGITCAVCHSTVDNSFAPGIGRRLDGWPNQDLNVGEIVAAAPNLQPLEQALNVNEATLKKVLLGWGPGFFNAELNLDGKAIGPDGTPHSAATRIPSAFGKDGQNLHTWEGGWGTVTYWNAFVANLEMHGIGNFFDPRLDDRAKFPIAAAARFGHTHPYVGEGVLPVPTTSTAMRDQTTEALRALDFYQHALPAPRPPKGSFNAAAAKRGEAVFNGPGRCASCHMGSIGTAPGYNAVPPSAICIDSFAADRGPDGTYTIAPLQALFTRSARGFYHDGRFKTLLDVVNHYDSCFKLGLSSQQKSDLVQYLKSR